MTTEEAIEILEEVKTIDDSMYQYNSAYLEALDMAIEALKAKPCEDTISRKHLLSEIDDLMKSPWFNNGKDFYDGTIRHYGYVERKEAVEIVRDLCVKAEPLVTPKPTECEDAVSREAVLDIVNNPLNIRLDKIIKALPPVTPKQRTGKWIKVVTEIDSFGNETYHHECSVCKCDKSGWEEYRFCPDCGTKMEGEANEHTQRPAQA